jgi:Icc-related predicted phosphoesterase
VIRVAAVGDVHAGIGSAGRLRQGFAHLGERADALFLAGDLTRTGSPLEAKALVAALAPLVVPTVAVLGNHDYHADQQDTVVAILEDAGVVVLEGGSTTIELGHCTLGVAGVKGFGGGFPGGCATEFGEPEMKAFIGHSRRCADRLRHSLENLTADVVVALLHYSPTADTLRGEPAEIHAFLGSYLLAEAIDEVGGVDLVVHGHAHRGSERGQTPSGVPVRNVAQPVLGHSYKVYVLHGDGGLDEDEAAHLVGGAQPDSAGASSRS